jgi:hypothetical protein
MKKVTDKLIFFVETIFFFVTVHLVPLLKKICFAAKLILVSNFFTKNKLSKVISFVKKVFFFVTVHLVPLFKKKRFAAKLILANDFFVKNKITTKTIFFAPVLYLVYLIFVPSLLLAQVSSDFTISANLINDITPPTTPTMLSVVPVAYNQIDVTWSASTDNYLLDGYVLLRDGTPIATTTLTTYIDTGLTASTTYSYEVYAFDPFYNLSTTSNALSTTTLEAPPTPPAVTSTTPTNTTATRVLRLENLEIVPDRNSATFLWKTNNPSRFTLRWGRSDAYDEGYILNDIYRTSHQTLVSDLEPGTVYLYELIGYGNNGIAISLKKGEFKTAASANVTPPNVQNLQAVVLENNVSLSWQMPDLFANNKVRIVRSHLGYPVDPYDGAVIFEGEGNSFFDKQALETYSSQYYTVFVLSDDGSVSSGAVVKAKRKSALIPSSTSTSTETEDPFIEELIEIPDFGFSVENIKLKQGDKLFDFKSERIFISESEPFIISILFSSLPKHLKSIVVTLMDPQNQNRSYSFLLRINKDRTAYEATIAPIKSFGASRLQIEIYDFERQIIGRYRKQIDFVSAGKEPVGEVIFPDKIVGILGNIISPLFLIFLVILMILFLLYRRSKETEDNH